MNDDITQWMTQAKDGDNQAFNAIIRRFQKRVFTMALVMTKNMADADDVTQEVFITLYQKISTIRKPEKIQSWLLQTAVYKATDLIRKRQIRKWIPFMEEKAKGNERPDQDLYRQELRKLFNEWEEARLSQKEQLVFQMRHGEELSLGEIAEVLGMQVGTVKSHLNRGMKKIKEMAERSLKRGDYEGS